MSRTAACCRCLASPVRRRRQAAPHRHPGRPERSAGDEPGAEQRHQRHRILPRQERRRRYRHRRLWSRPAHAAGRHLAGAGSHQAAQGHGLSRARSSSPPATTPSRAWRRPKAIAIPMVPDATIVPSGVVHLMELQEQGWSYVRAVAIERKGPRCDIRADRHRRRAGARRAAGVGRTTMRSSSTSRCPRRWRSRRRRPR